mmetsp:Transcript_36222/g.87699  ORF Transcript_36222/g.87699 Transcript_36222/m.87699 type:complete len:108 (+) Transcript_36222:1054-1377(+)
MTIADEEDGIPAEVELPRCVVAVPGAEVVVPSRGVGVVAAVEAVALNRDEVIAPSLARAEVILVSEVEDDRKGDTPLRADQVAATRTMGAVLVASVIRVKYNSVMLL